MSLKVQSYRDKIWRNSGEFRKIPRKFRTAYGIYGSEKKVRNSVLTEFRKHPILLMYNKFLSFGGFRCKPPSPCVVTGYVDPCSHLSVLLCRHDGLPNFPRAVSVKIWHS
jgi:hypothetical protein